MNRALIILALVTVVALPFALRPAKKTIGRADGSVVIITPHNEAIRQEYAQGFQDWYREKTGRTVTIDWRVIGGTSEIARFLESEYVASFQNHWTRKLGKPWSMDVQASFANPRLPKDAGAEAQAARREFMASEVGCGIDVFFGGGTFDFIRQADAGRIVDSGLLQRRPEWFTDDVIPASYTGEPFRDKQGRWLGPVLSGHGMLYNHDALARLGIANPPREWADLTDPKYLGEVAVCDPTKSGSIAKSFESIIQEQIYLEWAKLAADTGRPKADLEKQAVAQGWERGLRLLLLVSANARYFTDSSQKPPIDVAAGNCAVGMCIDFYGRYQEQSSAERSGRQRLGFHMPEGGTTLSPDPIALMRGAPNREIAEAFIEYVMSMEGQKLWNLKPGTSGGPQHFSLRRLPIRKDFYRDAALTAHRADPEVNPYAGEAPLVYNATWTGSLFREMSFVIRIMGIDTHNELAAAWRAINAPGVPAARRAEALAVLTDLSAVGYEQMFSKVKPALTSKNKVDEVRFASELAGHFRAQYKRAEQIAKGGY
ncbi:MAG: iron(III) transport system substrate-binding protein [Verrucomicrobiota bacterium]|nr:iron(III) transport system substrate-binding protein [Verrucomicrobiota bacterium]